ncbi:NADH dehydrogenase [ubiquinone] flavoprotein 3, mitochondrial isoform X1 [Melospiza georgiana]|uniref:NADH dehydrogenase [ubiquinone] flavoprotein 3, mitochondrial isoform X1 n=2 Tax=Melospiza georgiana TaxID=44398 RepID=UPI0025ABEAC2|nr:NADH dehydrogenase [ubiquinone] flavoprotein 3, mitochondrial isoform X1 [Melospiza georgiana]
MAAAAALRGGGRAAIREVLQLEARGLCTKPVGTGMAPPPPPPPKNVAAPQGSTKLLAMKAPVEFRKMLSSSSLLLSADKGESSSSTTLKEAAESAEDTRMPKARKTQVAFPQRGVVSSREGEKLSTPARGGGLRKKLAEKQSSSSSSSDSSSDSEDESVGDSKVATKTKVEFPRRDPVFSENIAVKASMLAKEKLSQKSLKEYGIKKLPRKPEIDVSPVKQVSFSKTSVGQETSKPKARDPKAKSPPKEQKPGLEPHTLKGLGLSNVTAKSDHVEEKSTGLKASAVTQEDKKQDLLSRGEKEKMKEAQKLEAKEVTAPKVEETSRSRTLVMETTQEGAQAGEGSTTEEPAQPAPEEEWDNSTYKNLQHHDYHTFTFHDYVAILAKYRQPQPSSGRPSPRH